MASDRMWGGLPFIVPSNTAMKYMFHEKVINEEDVPVGAHYRAREDMLNIVRYHVSNNNENIGYEAVCPQLCGCSLEITMDYRRKRKGQRGHAQ